MGFNFCVRAYCVRSHVTTNVHIVGGARVPCHSPIRILVSELSSSMFTLKMMAASSLLILILPVVESGREVSGLASGLILNARE